MIRGARRRGSPEVPRQRGSGGGGSGVKGGSVLAVLRPGTLLMVNGAVEPRCAGTPRVADLTGSFAAGRPSCRHAGRQDPSRSARLCLLRTAGYLLLLALNRTHTLPQTGPTALPHRCIQLPQAFSSGQPGHQISPLGAGALEGDRKAELGNHPNVCGGRKASKLPVPRRFSGDATTIIGTIPLMPNPGPSSQAASGTQGLQVQPVTPQLLTNAQGQIIATVIGNQILPVINTQGITLSPIKPGQQDWRLATGKNSQLLGDVPCKSNKVHPNQHVSYSQHPKERAPFTSTHMCTSQLHQPSQTSVGQAASQGNLLHLAHSQASMSQSPVRQASSSSSSSSSSSALSVGQLVSNPQTAAGEVDGVNLEEIREFAKAFKIRRLSLGLTQTQVGQALSATEGPAYSQSAICRHTILRSHFFLPQEAQENTIASSLTAKLNPGLLYPARFEKLDITPKSAQKIKPVLERWMAEAEARHRAGMQNLTEFIGSEPSKKRKRRTSFTPQALEILNAHFEKNTHPSGQEMTEIAEKLNYDREVVRVWFCNKRQALKNTIKRLKQHEPATAVPLEPLTDSLEENS
ncbi:POU domain, class 6, transcription factor 2-like [Nomascus leucogenys]|uniref:POU domain, class 6, transcription factor 2-like n=1 Tax=Nomascus leucogenys TaxID=61853 RepID=UPI00122D57E8|nr:POU domain, class 6, transcription factor 2-like [Nomascus leucogenys]